MTDQLKSQLAATHKELEKIKAEYAEFVYIISHDLQAPLRQIEGFVDLLSLRHDDDLDDKSKRHLALIVDGSNKAKKLLNALVEYSRLNTLRSPFISINCNELMEEVSLELSSLIELNNVTITYPKLPNIVGDKDQIFQLFYHLIHNAITYQNTENPPQINIDFKDKISCWEFSIQDNGIGIKDKLTEKIFKVLRRAVSDKHYPGMGMGLALSKKILELHGGDIRVESKIESGSTFYFTLPKEHNYD